MLINKKFKSLIDKDIQCGLIICEQTANTYQQQQRQLMKRLEFFDIHKQNFDTSGTYVTNTSSNPANDVLRVGFLKFVIQNQPVGDYLLNQLRKIEDYIINQTNNKKNNVSDKKVKSEIESIFSKLNQKLFSKNDAEDLKKGSLGVASTQSQNNLLQSNQTFKKLDINVLIDPSIVNLFVEERETAQKQLITQSEDIKNQLVDQFQDLLEQKINSYQFTVDMIKHISVLYVFSKMLLQETKELYQLQNYLVNQILNKNNLILHCQNQLDDFRYKTESDTSIKIYLNQSIQQLNNIINRQENELIKSQRETLELNKKTTTLENNLEKSNLKIQDYETKLSYFASELKSLLEKHDVSSKKLSHLTKSLQWIQQEIHNLSL